MPLYRVTFQDISQGSPVPLPRGLNTGYPGHQDVYTSLTGQDTVPRTQPPYTPYETVTIHATDIAHAAHKAHYYDEAPAFVTIPVNDRRITCIEEVMPVISYTDEQVSDALRSQAEGNVYLGDLWDDHTSRSETGTGDLFNDTDDTYSIFGNIIYALNESGLVPGLDISYTSQDPTDEQYCDIQILDKATNIYRSYFVSIDWFFTQGSNDSDTYPRGWEGVVQVAQRIIDFINEKHLA